MFYTRFNPPPTIPSSSGNRFEPVYEYTVTKFGKTLRKTDKTQDIYEMIQVNAVGTSLAEIIKKCTLMQDDSLLMQRPGGYVDCTELPRDFAEMQNSIIRARESFMKLSVDVRQKFNNDPDKYIIEMFTPAWNEIMGVTVNKPDKEVAKDAPLADKAE